ncbi:MAG: hypothetical protein JNK26_03480 [Candidatus Doudnabacteria bacterium]|nr:hypothetical protein [Candidatus Doudnabacteria bacterium]
MDRRNFLKFGAIAVAATAARAAAKVEGVIGTKQISLAAGLTIERGGFERIAVLDITKLPGFDPISGSLISPEGVMSVIDLSQLPKDLFELRFKPVTKDLMDINLPLENPIKKQGMCGLTLQGKWLVRGNKTTRFSGITNPDGERNRLDRVIHIVDGDLTIQNIEFEDMLWATQKGDNTIPPAVISGVNSSVEGVSVSFLWNPVQSHIREAEKDRRVNWFGAGISPDYYDFSRGIVLQNTYSDPQEVPVKNLSLRGSNLEAPFDAVYTEGPGFNVDIDRSKLVEINSGNLSQGAGFVITRTYESRVEIKNTDIKAAKPLMVFFLNDGDAGLLKKYPELENRDSVGFSLEGGSIVGTAHDLLVDAGHLTLADTTFYIGSLSNKVWLSTLLSGVDVNKPNIVKDLKFVIDPAHENSVFLPIYIHDLASQVKGVMRFEYRENIFEIDSKFVENHLPEGLQLPYILAFKIKSGKVQLVFMQNSEAYYKGEVFYVDIDLAINLSGR